MFLSYSSHSINLICETIHPGQSAQGEQLFKLGLSEAPSLSRSMLYVSCHININILNVCFLIAKFVNGQPSTSQSSGNRVIISNMIFQSIWLLPVFCKIGFTFFSLGITVTDMTDHLYFRQFRKPHAFISYQILNNFILYTCNA